MIEILIGAPAQAAGIESDLNLKKQLSANPSGLWAMAQTLSLPIQKELGLFIFIQIFETTLKLIKWFPLNVQVSKLGREVSATRFFRLILSNKTLAVFSCNGYADLLRKPVERSSNPLR